jgi:hypothetical protein
MPYRDPEKKRRADNSYVHERNRNIRDITEGYPEPGDMEARGACERDFRLFCEWYFPNAFYMAWGEEQLRAIERMQRVILEGGLFAFAMPRSTGKTALAVRASLWSLLYGHRRFVSLLAATEEQAKQLLAHFKAEIVDNEPLARDFRQVCYPIRRLENNGRKAIGQLFDGEQTRITWKDDRLTLPIMPDWACDGTNVSGSVIRVAGLTGGNIRGQSATLPSGEIIRPELVLLDDPQTRESAASKLQSAGREEIVKGDVLGMAGPKKRIAALMACTVIRKDDMADLMLDRKRNPSWSGQKTRMVNSFPTDEKLWDEYKQIRIEDMESELGTARCTEFYRANRAAMDAGASVSWAARYNEDEISAVQHAMNLRIDRGEAAFFAEYQNEPLPDVEIQSEDVTADQVAEKLSGFARGLIPSRCNRVTAFIDVQGSLLFYLVAAWADDFTGYVIDYGAYPDQKRAYFTLSDAKNKLSDAIKGAGQEGQVTGGLKMLTGSLLARNWLRDDGSELKIERCLIDSGYLTETVVEFCRSSPFGAILTPSKGMGIGAKQAPMREWPRREGERAGLNWRLSAARGGKAARQVVYDANFWKTFVFARLSTAIGDRGSLSLFGTRPADHRLFADHLTSEYRTKTAGKGRELYEWSKRPNAENHWLDCLVGAFVAASMQGVAMPETAPMHPKPAASKPSGFAEFRRRQAERKAQQARVI